MWSWETVATTSLKEELALNNNVQIVEFGANIDNHKREMNNAKKNEHNVRIMKEKWAFEWDKKWHWKKDESDERLVHTIMEQPFFIGEFC